MQEATNATIVFHTKTCKISENMADAPSVSVEVQMINAPEETGKTVI